MSRSRTRQRHLVLTLGAALTAGAARAEFPGPLGSDPWEHRPNDPRYPAMWQLFSHLPVDHVGAVSDWQRQVGSGMHVDRAWQLHTGTPATVIAVLDSGIKWDERDLIDRHYLNTRELPPPTGGVYDANGDGRVAVSDYAGDGRVHDANANGLVDAGDLIKIFSDGVDDDGNGFVDDIAGWDFHEHDNDPGDRTRFGHGTGEALDSVGALNNGIGGAGICGECTFMALRLNDSFIVDANAFSDAIVYAVDQGADLIQQALGSANANEYTQEAVDYAYARDVVVIGSAADENSYHHNYPSTLDPVLYTNAIRYDTQSPEDAASFVAFNACSNYGARVDVATSGRSCSSEATANLAGISGLTLSYAASLGKPLGAGELISLIKVAATDIALGPASRDSQRHPTYEGWDQYTGYGRTNAFAMLERVRQDRIPPVARIVEPRWFSWVGVGSDAGGFAVQVEGATRVAGGVSLRVEVARGVETAGVAFTTVLETPLLPDGFTGTLATVPLATLAALPVNSLDGAHDRDAYTLRLVVTDARGDSAEARRTVFYHADSSLLAGYPRALGGSGESAGTFFDVDGDGLDEYVTADGAGFVHALKADGRELAGFPSPGARSRYGLGRTASSASLPASIYAPVAVGDLDGDGKAEIVAVSMEGHVNVWNANGALRPGFPVTLPFPDMSAARADQIIAPGSLAAPVLVDLDLDGRLEIVAPGLDGLLHVLKETGQPQSGFPVALEANGKRAKLVSSPAVADVDGDDYPDLIMGSNHEGEESGYLFAVRGAGASHGAAVLTGFPARLPMIRDVVLPTVGTGIPTAPVVADFDGDGVREILVHAFVGKAYLFDLSGRIKTSLGLEVASGHGTNDRYMLPAFGHPAAGDVTGDGRLSPVTVGAGQRMLVAMALGGKRYEYNHMLGAWDATTGAMRAGFPKALDDMALGVSPLLIDLDNDGRREIVAGSGGYFLHAFSAAGGAGEPAGFPRFTGGWIFGAASAGDMDGDGRLEIAATTREGYVFVWRTEASTSQRSKPGGWLTFKGNPQRTGGM